MNADLWAFAPRRPLSLPIDGEPARFPVHRIFCVGRNFAEHAREMGAAIPTGAPVLFTKPADAIIADGADVPYPPGTIELHHEVELVVAIGGEANRVCESGAAADLVFGFAVGLDLTRRDLQRAAKSGGLPWDSAKGFAGGAPIGAVQRMPLDKLDLAAELSLTVNGIKRQGAALSDMIFDVEAVIAAILELWPLGPGDLIMMGTPEGVGPLERGDRFIARCGDLPALEGQVIRP